MTAPLLVIFDMDGTLVDSEGAIASAGRAALCEYGISPALRDFLPFTGMGDDRFIGGVAEQYGLTYDPRMKARAYEVYMEHPELVTVFPWSVPTVRGVRARGIATAVASASDRVKVLYNLHCLGLSEEDFAALITGSDVTRQKPDPEIFLLAAARAGIPPARCLVCEDSLSGVRAAVAAGMTAAAVTTSYPAADLRAAGATLVTDDLTAVLDLLPAPGAKIQKKDMKNHG